MRKTSNLSKVIALALSLIMAFSMSASAFAAEVADITYSQATDNCEVITIDLDEILAETDVENLNARASISLGASKAKLFNIGTLSADQTVTITVKWTPSNYNLHIGLVKSTSSSGNLAVVSGGSATINATVSSAGTYYLMIANPSTTQDLTISTLTYAK